MRAVHTQHFDKFQLARELADVPATKPPKIRLRYGQVIWLLTELGYSEGVSRNTLHEYIKALRRFGIPFGHMKFQTKGKKKLAEYSYCHLMELALVLSLRVYHVVPDSILKGIAEYRARLHRFYNRSYMERCGGAGSPLTIEVQGRTVELRGLFLDLDIRFSAGHMVRFGPPKLMPPREALTRFSQSVAPARSLVPICLSRLSELIVETALRAPEVRSGPRSKTSSRSRLQDVKCKEATYDRRAVS